MPKRTYPLELVLRAHGPAELVNANEETLWASDADEDFKEEFNDEFLSEDDLGDIFDFLYHNEIISDKEFDHFENQDWECIIESLENSVNEPDDDDDGGENEDFD